MADVDIKVVADNTEMFLKEFEGAIGKALEEVGILAEGHVVGYMTANGIVDTGRLRDSITHMVDGGEKVAIIGTNVEYGPYVHNGTRSMAARPFLTDPVQQHKDEYGEVFKSELGGA